VTWLAHHVAGFFLTLAVVAVVVAAVRLAEYADRLADRRQAALDAAVVDGIVADAEAAYAGYVQSRANAALADEYADRFPMPKRPAAPAAEPGESWQLPHKNDTLGPRLVERADLTETLDGENR